MAHLFVAHSEFFFQFIRRHGKNRLLLSCGIGASLIWLIHGWYQRHCIRRLLSDKKSKLKESFDQIRAKLNSMSKSPEQDLLNLTKLSISDLREKLTNNSVTPEILLHAFQLKALQLYDEGNSGICEFIQEAEEIFTSLFPSSLSLSSEDRSPLYGIPVSIKESFRVENYDSTAGCIKQCNQPNSESCVVVEVLRKAGAIPFVLTSTSQLCRTIDGFNPVFGNILNPFDPKRITGGSSSGEAVLLAQYGSPVGIGSDVGGSLRIPCAYCGLVCLKPTVNRISGRGMFSILNRSVLELTTCPGPMGRRVDDMADVMRTLLKPLMFDLDPTVPPLPFNEEAYRGPSKFPPLVIGYFDNVDGIMITQTVPAVRQAIDQTVTMLRDLGHEVIPFQVPDPERAYQLFIRCIFADGNTQLQSRIAYEPVGPQLRFLTICSRLPLWFRALSDSTLHFIGYGPISVTHTMGGIRSLQAVMDLRKSVQDYREQFRLFWNKTGPLDALICPVSAFPAPPSAANPMFVSPSVFYTGLFNLLDYPAGTVPVGSVEQAHLVAARKQSIRRWLDGDKHGAHVHVMQVGSQGLPTSVQVVGLPYREESVLRVMRMIEKCVDNSAATERAKEHD